MTQALSEANYTLHYHYPPHLRLRDPWNKKKWQKESEGRQRRGKGRERERLIQSHLGSVTNFH